VVVAIGSFFYAVGENKTGGGGGGRAGEKSGLLLLPLLPVLRACL